LVAGHADYAARTDVGPETKAELWGDLLGTTTEHRIALS